MNHELTGVEGVVWVRREPEVRFMVAGDGRTARAEQYKPLDELTRRLLAARPGDRVAMPTPGQPPWIVVDHELDRVLVAGWPGRLLRVRVAPSRTARERDAMDAVNEDLGAGRWYTRAAVVDVLDELPAHVLFGPWGRAVAEVIEAAADLTPDQARTLATARNGDAPAVYQRTWRRWLQQRQTPAAHGSPVGRGLGVINHLVTLQAARHQAATWEADPDDPEEHELVLAPPWSQAASALAEAALALGNPATVEADWNVLTSAWRSWRSLPQ
jgi:hypothetical protein